VYTNLCGHRKFSVCSFISSVDQFNYSLRPIILFANIDVSRHILVIDTFVLAKNNMD
jgi:hypothetical protein